MASRGGRATGLNLMILDDLVICEGGQLINVLTPIRDLVYKPSQ